MVVLEAESADGWESIVSGCFVPLRCAGFEAQFTGRMEHVAVGERLSVSQVTTCGTSAERTGRLADSADSDDIHISLQRSSRGTIVGDGRAAMVGPGSVSIYATDRPYYLDYSRPDQQQLIVQVSRHSLGLPRAMLEDSMFRLMVPGGWRVTAARNLFSYAELLRAKSAPDAAETLRDLASAMIRSSFGEGAGVPRSSGGLRHAVQEYLSRNATRQGLDMDLVAREHFVSRRRLYQVFEQVGQSPAAFLRTERLRLAERMLSEHPSRLIEWIAYECGFRDLTTFTRAFRREFGCTPRQWRAAVTQGRRGYPAQRSGELRAGGRDTPVAGERMPETPEPRTALAS